VVDLVGDSFGDLGTEAIQLAVVAAGLLVVGVPAGVIDRQPVVVGEAGLATSPAPVRGEDVLPAGDLDPDEGGGGVAFAFAVVGAVEAAL
jgi:hypothetical protein